VTVRSRRERREEAEERNDKWAALSDSDKLTSLKRRGHGHCKQADKLRANIAKDVK